jgi:hypothetical protein
MRSERKNTTEVRQRRAAERTATEWRDTFPNRNSRQSAALSRADAS